ncbi:4-hydroxybenzoate polyprenyltransferase [Aquabacterium commune]|uniref:4-hydroxybenzoate polyprenyltransferase n=1 Tax=Aquabacterium commune TaxID=70586 RepID=A0A4R6RPF9_9BURK|nr:UbiA family prenyltransferase [Aquabacterium commune]TDP88560.1 4-hydroxybenzoate polyprenyltransferase [Aquabacterium commune]
MSDNVALCVDLDGTLIHSDLLLESFLLLIKDNPFYLLLVPFWLLGGKARLKREIASRVKLDGSALPYTKPLVAWLQEQKAAGRQLWLCTASDESLARAVADHLGFFDGVLASNGQTNLSGSNKAAALVAKFGEKGFDYCGNEKVDLRVWPHARGAIVVNASAPLAAAAARVTQVLGQYPFKPAGLKVVLKALRVHQWAKNALIFVPVAAAHQLGDVAVIGQALMAFVAFSLCASSVYLLNDMLDLAADRQHHSKCHRPFAAGTLSLLFGLMAAPLLLVAAVLISLCLPAKFLLVLTGYYVVTLAYSFSLKRMVMIDVLTLAGLYTVRIVAGAAATAIPLSFWLLMFAIFIFLSLAIVKRYAELHQMKVQGKLKAQGRGYQVEDLSLLQSLGGASGYLSILVLALYLNTPDIARMYHQPKLVWLLVPIMLYWVSRIWMQTHRGNMHDDPLVYALKDRVSLITGAMAAVVLALAV